MIPILSLDEKLNWAHKIAVNLALTELRRKRWQDFPLNSWQDSGSGDFTPRFLTESAPEPDNMVARNEMLELVEHLIAEELTMIQSNVLVSVIIQGETVTEVAEKMNTNPNTIYKRLHDARKRLKRQLAQKGLTPSEVLAVFV